MTGALRRIRAPSELRDLRSHQPCGEPSPMLRFGMRRLEQFRHIIEIVRWRFDYYFGVNELPQIDTAYLDHRAIEIEGVIREPSAIKAKHALVTLMPVDRLIDAAKESTRKFGDRLPGARAEPKTIAPVGYVHYRGAKYSAKIYFPSDMTQPILSMLTADRYKYIKFDAAKGGNDAAIFSFELRKLLSDEPELAASWDDA